MTFDASPVTVAMPGTCGELVQGWYASWAEPILISCPIDRCSYVTVWLCPGPDIDVPEGHFKTWQAARLLLDRLGRPDLGARVRLRSHLLPGRGLGSSTADVVGVMAGLALALGSSLSAAELARLACRIEPSDSTMFAGLAMLAYRGSGQVQELGPAPSLSLLMLDSGGTVDTLAYNAGLDLAAVRRLAATTQAALDLLNQGLAHNDPATIGAAATLSAAAYQAVSHSPLLSPVQAWAGDTGALGVVRAHSGSLFGLLYPPGADLSEPARWLARRFDGELAPTRLTGGGYRVIEELELGRSR